MMEIMKYEARRRMRGTLILLVGIAAFSVLIVYLFPAIESAAGAIEELIAAYPESVREAFGIRSYASIGGFLATELYQFVWTLMLGLYFIYLAGGVVAKDVETGRIDLLLATPVSRKRVLVEKYCSILVPIVLLNIVMPLVVLGAAMAIGESLSITNLILLHLVSIPYFMATASLGLSLSVVFDRADVAQRGGLALLFMLFVVDAVTTGTDLEFLGVLSPTRYFDPTEILVDGTVDIGGTVILLSVAIVLVILTGEWFHRMDV